MQILEDFWYGRLHPMEQDHHRIEEHRALVRLYERNETRLLATLNDGQKEEFQKIKDIVEEMQGIAACGAFIVGFRLATRLLAESMAGDEIAPQ